MSLNVLLKYLSCILIFLEVMIQFCKVWFLYLFLGTYFYFMHHFCVACSTCFFKISHIQY